MYSRLGGPKGGLERAGDYDFLTAKETKIINWENDFFVHHRIVSAVKRVEFVSDRASYIVLRGRWCNNIVLNVHAPSEEKSDDSKDGFYKELEKVFDHFSTYHMKILLGEFNEKLEREYFQQTIANENIHQDSNDNGVT